MVITYTLFHIIHSKRLHVVCMHTSCCVCMYVCIHVFLHCICKLFMLDEYVYAHGYVMFLLNVRQQNGQVDHMRVMTMIVD